MWRASSPKGERRRDEPRLPSPCREVKGEGVSEGLDWLCRYEGVAKVGGLALEPLVLALVVFGFEGGEDGIVVGAGSLTS